MKKKDAIFIPTNLVTHISTQQVILHTPFYPKKIDSTVMQAKIHTSSYLHLHIFFHISIGVEEIDKKTKFC